MVIGTGIDIVNIDRIERVMARWGDLFLGRVFTEKEIVWCQRRTRPSECFATRFAAKEAFLKAIGWGLRNGIQWTDIEVENDPMGKPSFALHRKAKEVLKTLRIKKALLTLSHDRPYAVAHVLLEERNDESSDCRTNARAGSKGHRNLSNSRNCADGKRRKGGRRGHLSYLP